MESWRWHCLVCDKHLTTWTDNYNSVQNPISEGISCFSMGSPGSQKFNAQSEEDGELVFVVCDECLTAKANKIMHMTTRVETITNFKMRTLDGKDEQDEEPPQAEPEQEA